MEGLFRLTLSEVLAHEVFTHAEVIAGKKGLDNHVKWIHIIEVTQISHLLNGNELILTTGIGWESKKQGIFLLQQMINKKTSGLCIELGEFINDIPKEMIDLANEHNFPIIIFREEVRFLDITQRINSLFVESHDKMVAKLESVSNQFNHLLLSKDSFRKIMKLLHQTLNVQVIYLDKNQEAIFYPNVSKNKKEYYMEENQHIISQTLMDPGLKSAVKAVEALGIKFADLIIMSDVPLIDFDYLVLDRAATALSQNRLRKLYVQEKEKQKRNQWIHEWMNKELDELTVKRRLLEIKADIKVNECIACVYDPGELGDINLVYDSLALDSRFNQQGFYPLTVIQNKKLIIILINQKEKHDIKNRLEKVIETIRQLISLDKQFMEMFGIGTVCSLNNLHKSVEQAQETIFVKNYVNIRTHFYDELYVYQIILEMRKSGTLNDFVEKQLNPLIEHEKIKQGELLHTLKVLLQVNGSRKEAADQLFIVRQTLYHRIDKLKDILGDDFMEGKKRLALELALYGKDLIDGDVQSVK